MPSLTERETILLMEKAEYLGRTIRTHKSQTSGSLTDFYGVPVPGEGGEVQNVDWDFLQESNLGLLDTAVGRVRDTGHTHRLDQVKASQLRNQRDGVLGDLGERHDSLKLAIEATYGPDKLEVVGLDAPMVRKYLGVREQFSDIVTRMRRPNVLEQLGEPRANQSHLPMEALADGLEGDVKRFVEAYEAVSDMGKVLDISRVARNEARLHLRRVYTNVARMQEGMFRLAGMDELADRIRVTVPSRPKRNDEKDPGDPAQQEPPPADPTPAAAGKVPGEVGGPVS